MIALSKPDSPTGKASLRDKKTFGARLKQLREAAGLSQQALAARAGLSQRNIANWELGLREPGAFALPSLAEALGVELPALFAEPGAIPEPRRGRPRKSSTEPEAGEPPAQGKGKKKLRGST